MHTRKQHKRKTDKHGDKKTIYPTAKPRDKATFEVTAAQSNIDKMKAINSKKRKTGGTTTDGPSDHIVVNWGVMKGDAKKPSVPFVRAWKENKGPRRYKRFGKL